MTTHVAWSEDGGHKWTIAGGTTHPGYLRSFDAVVAFDPRGHAFILYLAMDEMSFLGPTTRHGEFLHRSLDGGRTWNSSPITLIERAESQQDAVFEHMPKIAADTHAASPHVGNLYAVWDRQSFELRNGDIAVRQSEIMFTRSRDEGKTWSSPRAIDRYAATMNQGVTVGRDGTVYVMYAISKPGDYQIALSVSRDGGETFSGPRPVARTPARTSPVSSFPRSGANGRPSIAIDPRGAPGRLFVVWGDFRNGDRDIFSTTSVDEGRTWALPVRINDDPKSNGKDQAMSWLAVDPSDGSAYVLFYDRRDDPKNLLATVTLARSADGGRTWANYAWSDRASDPKRASLGDYIGLAAEGGRVYGAWTEDVPGEPTKAPAETTRKAEPGEFLVDGRSHPFGPSAIKIGIADFRAAAKAAR